MARVVLGPTGRVALNGATIKVASQSLRPGSGHLSVEMVTDGPSRVITVANVGGRNCSAITWKPRADEGERGLLRSGANSGKGKCLEVYVNLTGGIGVSLIQWLKQEYEELIYGYLKSLEVNFEQNSLEQTLTLNVQSIQVSCYS